MAQSSRRAVAPPIDAHRHCTKCGVVKAPSEFHLYRGKPTEWCKECRNAYQRAYHASKRTDPKYIAARHSRGTLRRHGVTGSEYLRRMGAQGNLCAICAEPLVQAETAHYDHCHLTGKFRGFLCSGCNRGLGYFRDNPAVLRDAATYLEDRA